MLADRIDHIGVSREICYHFGRIGCPNWRLGLDDIDQRLVSILRRDSRRSISDLAGELGLSRATVRARIGRLETAGVIIGYTVVLRADAVSAPVRGLTMIEVEGRALDRVIDALAGFAEIGAIHTTNGRWDLVVELSAQSLTDLDAVLRRLRLTPGITASETSLLLATPRSTQARL
jgi:DNA-binding Lrp family transcriptional regulator